MMDREQLKELKEMLINGDHPTKDHREQLLSLVNAALVKPIEDEEILKIKNHLNDYWWTVMREGQNEESEDDFDQMIEKLIKYQPKPRYPIPWPE